MVYELIISIEHERRWLCAYDLWCGYVKYLPFCISHSLDAEMLVLHYFQVTHECKCTAYIQHTEGLLWWLLLFISRLDCTMPGHCRRGSFVVCAPHTHTLTPRKNWQEESNPICPVHEWESERERVYNYKGLLSAAISSSDDGSGLQLDRCHRSFHHQTAVFWIESKRPHTNCVFLLLLLLCFAVACGSSQTKW